MRRRPINRRRYYVPFLAAIVGALCLGAVAAWSLRADLRGAAPRAERVLVVEERALVAQGQGVPRLLKDSVARLDPGTTVTWFFETVDPSDRLELARTIDRYAPRVVILLNENLLAGLGTSRIDAHFLVPSELPPRVIRDVFGGLRQKQDLAFMSWFLDGYPKSIAKLRELSSHRVECIAGFFHSSLLREGIDRYFVAAARSQGIDPVVVPYADFDEFVSKLRGLGARCQGLVIPISEGISNAQRKVAAVVAESALPAAYTRGDQVKAGGLFSVEPPELEIYEQLAHYTVLMLHGARGSELEITQPSRIQMSVNLGAADAIGLIVPYDMLLEAALVHR